MIRVTLSHYTDEESGEKMHTVLVGGSPVIRETTDAERAEATARRVFGDHYGRAVLVEWDGDALTEVERERK